MGYLDRDTCPYCGELRNCNADCDSEVCQLNQRLRRVEKDLEATRTYVEGEIYRFRESLKQKEDCYLDHIRKSKDTPWTTRERALNDRIYWFIERMLDGKHSLKGSEVNEFCAKVIEDWDEWRKGQDRLYRGKI